MAYEKKKKAGYCSQRQYAKKLGCSNVHLKNLIDQGVFPEDAIDEGTGYIIEAIADKMFGEQFVKQKEGKVLASGEKLSVGKKGPAFEAKGKSYSPPPSPTGDEEGVSTDGEGSSEFKWLGGEIGNDLDFQEALRVERIMKARQVQQKIDVEAGKLLERDLVERQLHTAGTEIRKAIERMPGRLVDIMRASIGRDEALLQSEDVVATTLLEVIKAIEDIFAK